MPVVPGWHIRNRGWAIGAPNNGQYPTAMTALAGMALLARVRTTTQGKYAANLRKSVDYLVTRSRSNGLIGDPARRPVYLRPRLLDDVPLAGAGRRGG